MCTMVVTQLPTAPLLLLLLAVKLGAKGTVHSLLLGPTGTSRAPGLWASDGKVKALGRSSSTFHVAPFSLEALLRLAGLFLPLGLPSKRVRKSGGSAGLRGLGHAWLACGWLTCVALLDLRRLLMAREPPGPGFSNSFLLGSLPVTTEMERVMGLVAEALLGRRFMGGGRPVRLKSTPSRLPSGPLRALEPFMVDRWPCVSRAWNSGPVGPNGEGCAGPSKWRHGEPRLRADDLGTSRPRAPRSRR